MWPRAAYNFYDFICRMREGTKSKNYEPRAAREGRFWDGFNALIRRLREVLGVLCKYHIIFRFFVLS